MPLSEHEQRLLEQIERELYADDPKLASTVRAINPRTYAVRRLWRSVALFLAGLTVLVVGAVLNKGPTTVVLGLLGFILMLVAALRAAADLKRLGGRPEVTTKRTATRQRKRPKLRNRVEERWQRRWEDRDR